MDEEIWKDIRGYEGSYQVSNLGRVRSLDRQVASKGGKSTYLMRGISMTPREDKVGYTTVHLRLGGQTRKTKKLHRLVADAFVDNPELKPQVNHKDGIKSNNAISNLEWVTAAENNQHAYDTGLKKRGERHHKSKLTEKQVAVIRKDGGKTKQKELAARYSVDQRTVSAILNNVGWKHVKVVV